MKMESTKFYKLLDLLSLLEKNFKECYVVGGILRDLLLYKNLFKKKNIIDIDICVKNLQIEKLKEITSKLNLPFVILDEDNLVYRSVIKDTNSLVNVDFTNYTSLEEDILRRDFVINTLYLNLKHFINFLKTFDRKIFIHNLKDELKAKDDIRKKVLRVVEENSFEKDPLRILRAARFYSLGFKPDKKMNSLIEKYRELLSKVSQERITEEIKKIFNNFSYNVLEWMDKVKILDVVFPELEIIKIKGKNTQFRKFYFHPDGLWQHVKLAYKSVEKILKNLKRYFPKSHQDILLYIKNREYILKFIVLFHDIAKPLVAKKIKGKVRFFYHEIKSYEISNKILQRLRLSNEDISIITNIIKNHMRLGSLCVNRGVITQRAYLRLFRDLGDSLYFLVIFSLADRMSYETVPLKERKKYFKNFTPLNEFIKFENNLLEIYKDYKVKLSLPKLLNGHDIMKIFNIPEGPLVGKLLALIREAQILGKISTKEEAISLIKKHLKNYKSLKKT